MSSGPFEDGRYSTDLGDIVRIKCQEETPGLTLGGTANAFPTGAVEAGYPSATVSRSRASVGIHARRVTIRVTTPGSSGLSVGSVITLPWFQATGFNNLALGATGTYNTAAVILIGKLAEKIK